MKSYKFWIVVGVVFVMTTGLEAAQLRSDCTGFEAYSQPFDPVWTGSTPYSDQGFGAWVADNFVDNAGTMTPLSGTVFGLRWWGFGSVASPPFSGCTTDDVANTPFDLIFHSDTAGAPGAVVASITGVVPTISDTGVSGPVMNYQEYSATFIPITIAGASWVSIQRQTGDAACIWNWVAEFDSSTYDNQFYQFYASPPGNLINGDLTVCLAGDLAVSPATPITPIPAFNWQGITVLIILLAGFAYYYRRKVVVG